MERRHFPPAYLGLMALIIGAAVLGTLLVDPGSLTRFAPSAPFFFMGAAFLLLETKGVIQFSLLFGATWVVNALVFVAILVSVLLANWCVARTRVPRPKLLLALLLAAVAVGWLLPPTRLLAIEWPPARYLLSSVVFFGPVFLANLLFGQLFKGLSRPEEAYGWNILGAMLGGAVEYTAVVAGYRALSLVVFALYAAAGFMVFRVRRARTR
jgi:hypothetical protein